MDSISTKTFTTLQRLRGVRNANPPNILPSNDLERLNYDIASITSARKLQEKAKENCKKKQEHPFEKLQKTYTKKELRINMSSDTIPLISDQDVELGEPPAYNRVMNDNQTPTNDKTTHKFHRIFLKGDENIDSTSSIAFANISIRLAFLRKVLGILSFQIVCTFVFCMAFYLTPEARIFVQNQSWIVLLSSFGSIGILVAMFIYAHTVPHNFILLAIWTLFQAITVGLIVTFYDAELVLQAVFLTAAVVVGLFTYTLQSKCDFQKHYAIMFTLTIILLCATFIQLILMSSIFNFLVSMFGAIVFALYLVFDLHAVMHYYSEEDYIIACISIYMDIIGLFLRILEILNEINRNN